MRNLLPLLGTPLLLAACDPASSQTSFFYITGVVEEPPTQVVSDLNALPESIGLSKDRYWRQHGIVLSSEKRTLTSNSGEKAGYFKNDIQTYWSTEGKDKGKIAINFGIRTIGAKTRINISSGGAHTRTERVPESTMRRLASWLKNKYGADNITMCENAFC